jgi:hypothetical protein
MFLNAHTVPKSGPTQGSDWMVQVCWQKHAPFHASHTCSFSYALGNQWTCSFFVFTFLCLFTMFSWNGLLWYAHQVNAPHILAHTLFLPYIFNCLFGQICFFCIFLQVVGRFDRIAGNWTDIVLIFPLVLCPMTPGPYTLLSLDKIDWEEGMYWCLIEANRYGLWETKVVAGFVERDRNRLGSTKVHLCHVLWNKDATWLVMFSLCIDVCYGVPLWLATEQLGGWGIVLRAGRVACNCALWNNKVSLIVVVATLSYLFFSTSVTHAISCI